MLPQFTSERFAAVWRDRGLSARAGLFEALREHYAEPHRAYHTTRHIEECFAHLDLAREVCKRPAEIELALWFHDAIYDTHASDNELRSAEWAERELALASAPAEVSQSVRSLILMTKHDVVPIEHDAQVLVDIDLAILGAPRQRFLEYDAQIRIEYEWVPDDVFRRERAKVLQRFLARPSIYSTDFFRERLELQARRNILESRNAV